MERTDLLEALRKLAGTERLLIYDVEEGGAAQRPDPSTPFVSGGSSSWWQFVERRRALDDGDINLLVSLRGLRREERLLVMSWGVAFANSFLLLEPADPWLDLTTAAGIEDLSARSGLRDAGSLVGTAYAEWVYWTRNQEGELESEAASLNLDNPDATLWQTLWERLPRTFSGQDFLSWLTLLTLREAELFTGGREVARAIIPFLTRLGLPVLYDARHVIDGVRQLVNAGLATVQDPEDDFRVYRGPAEPLPASIPDERLMLMLR